MWGNHIQWVKIVINDNIIEQVTDLKYLGYCISEFKSDLEDRHLLGITKLDKEKNQCIREKTGAEIIYIYIYTHTHTHTHTRGSQKFPRNVV